MKRVFSILTVIFMARLACSPALAQAEAKTPGEKSEASSIEALTKRIDEQNAKLDALTQHILKLEQEIADGRPPVMVGEATPSPSATVAPPVATAAASGATHTVARGETLTAIAKTYKVSVEELQKLNHIENDRKLQIGQSLMIPSAPPASPAASAKKPNE